ncbi:Uncharacterized protein APZ42_007432 [Daphnia magna]|uniref:Uncharacterized protein n=1 Tax=Daphnia magna TaxID=35525 RepID=A0A164FAK6_9CRUS|nr:Uncharacterized protein APZ42_007432 [Daphnia magna]
MNCKTFSTGLSSGRLGWQRHDRDVGRDDKPVGEVPSSLVHQEQGMGAGSDGAADLGQWSCMDGTLQRGRTRAAPLPAAGQIAPKM